MAMKYTPILPVDPDEPASMPAARANSADDASPLETVDISTVPIDDVPDRKWIVKGVIPDRNVTDISSDGGLGKSLIGGLQLGIAMTAEVEWLGMDVVGGSFLYASCEDELDEVLRRRNSVLRAMGIPREAIKGFCVLDLTDSEETELALAGKSKAAGVDAPLLSPRSDDQSRPPESRCARYTRRHVRRIRNRSGPGS